MTTRKILSITYHDTPSEPTAAKGWRCEIIDSKPGMKRIKSQRVPGMFGFADLYITALDFVIKRGGPVRVAMVTIYLEREMKPGEEKDFRRQAVEQAGIYLSSRN